MTHLGSLINPCSPGPNIIFDGYGQGRPSPSETIMHFPPVSDFPPISEKFSDFLKFFYNFTFSKKISSLPSAKISDDLFLSSTTNFEFPPILAFQYISPLF